MSKPKTRLVWYPCLHSERSGAYWDHRAFAETGTIMHEEGKTKNPIRVCDKCVNPEPAPNKRREQRNRNKSQ
jgi:hypothetical protein